LKITALDIPDILVIEPAVIEDDRGSFFESFNHRAFATFLNQDTRFVQDNQSFSRKGVLRGLHYQLPPFAQGKLVRVLSGEVLDVSVDIRRSSPTFGKWVGVVLSAQNRKQLWIPPGFAHGFLTLSNTSEFAYKVSEYYKPEFERTIAWNDPELAIDWQVEPVLSEKDLRGLSLADAEIYD